MNDGTVIGWKRSDEALGEHRRSEYVSSDPEERFIYSRDPGTMEPSDPDLVVMPNTTEEVQQIVLLANQRRIPVVPMGGGLVLSGLTRPLKGGIVLDMKRMNRILEVNETGRSAWSRRGPPRGCSRPT